MATGFTVEYLRRIMKERYPDVDDVGEHPMTAVGTVLLSAATLGTTDGKTLIQFTKYSQALISAIALNMQHNGLWVDGRYDCSAWLSPEGTIEDDKFWDHISAACGELWFPGRDTSVSVDTCKIYWDERRGRFI